MKKGGDEYFQHCRSNDFSRTHTLSMLFPVSPPHSPQDRMHRLFTVSHQPQLPSHTPTHTHLRTRFNESRAAFQQHTPAKSRKKESTQFVSPPYNQTCQHTVTHSTAPVNPLPMPTPHPCHHNPHFLPPPCDTASQGSFSPLLPSVSCLQPGFHSTFVDTPCDVTLRLLSSLLQNCCLVSFLVLLL